MVGYEADPEDRGEAVQGGADVEAKEVTLYKSKDDKRQYPQTGAGVNMRKNLAMGNACDVGQVQARPAPVKGPRFVSNSKEYGR